MMSLFRQSHSFVLLISAPASGKTTYLLELVRDYPQFQWIFVSPLRALANEFKDRVGEAMIVETAEKLMAKKYDPYFERDDVIFVLDEFHLFSLWGESFRFALLHIWYKVATSQAHTLGLSATMMDTELKKVSSQVQLNYSQGYIVDCGNLEFKNPPERIHQIASAHKSFWNSYKDWELYKRAWRGRRNFKPALMIFVAYRSQVDDIVKRSRALGLVALGCKGGEVQEFCEQLKELSLKSRVDIIVSTSCLSHGVNLPSFDKVIIDHEVSESFWLQMAARGGRRGESFSLVCCDQVRVVSSFKQKIIFHLSMYLRKIHLCFMKEFWFINKLIKSAT